MKLSIMGAEIAHKILHVHNAGKFGLKNKKSVIANAHNENFVSSPRQNIGMLRAKVSDLIYCSESTLSVLLNYG